MAARIATYGATLTLLVFSASLLRAEEIYKTVDANGNVTYSDHADPSSPQTTVVELQDPRYPPHEMHFCWTNCFTLIYDGHQYQRADGTDETWSVEKFNANSFVLHRHDAPAQWNGFSSDVTYAGHLANDRLIGAALNGTPTSGIDASWGAALNTLPGTNAERDAASRDTTAVANVAIAPPPLLEDLQPAADQDGYLWTPGYWQWDGAAYVWVPGAWAQPPAVGLLWTPGYWAFANGRYRLHPGYWGPHVGFYGGINYGFGYFGTGYVGGHWVGNAFAYNSAVNHLNSSAIRNVYSRPASNPAARSLVSYNGGAGGATAVATEQDRLAKAEARLASVQALTTMHSTTAATPARVASPMQHREAGNSASPAVALAPADEAPPASSNQPVRPTIARNTALQTPKLSRPATKAPREP